MSAPEFRVTKERTCKHCRRSADGSSEQVLRVAGWRIYEGKSQTGKDISDTVCPWCAGTTDKPAPGWSVGCHTCDWEWEDEFGEGPLDEKAAQRMADDHECEAWTWTKPPVASSVPVSEAVVTGSLL